MPQGSPAATSAASPSSTPTVTGFHHSSLIVADTAKALEFYVGILALDLDDTRPDLGYPGALVSAIKNVGSGATCEMVYDELDINNNTITTGTLGELDATVNGFLLWEWEASASIDDQTKFISFDFRIETLDDFEYPDFADPDFVTNI